MHSENAITLDNIDKVDMLISTALGVGEILYSMSVGMQEIQTSDREALNVLANALHHSAYDLCRSGWDYDID